MLGLDSWAGYWGCLNRFVPGDREVSYSSHDSIFKGGVSGAAVLDTLCRNEIVTN
jgi:hypothetical protein